MILTNIQYSQLEAGIPEPLLENPNIHISYLTPTWITSVHQYLSRHNLTVHLTTDGSQSIRVGDQHIMQAQHLSRFIPIQQRDLNLVRIFLQVYTLSDLMDSQCPNHIIFPILTGNDRRTGNQAHSGHANSYPLQYNVFCGTGSSKHPTSSTHRTGISHHHVLSLYKQWGTQHCHPEYLRLSGRWSKVPRARNVAWQWHSLYLLIHRLSRKCCLQANAYYCIGLRVRRYSSHIRVGTGKEVEATMSMLGPGWWSSRHRIINTEWTMGSCIVSIEACFGVTSVEMHLSL